MSDEPTSGPPRVAVTAEFLAECRRKQAAYAASRRLHRERLARAAWGNEDEEPAPITSSPNAPAMPRLRRSRPKSIDPRQLKLEL